MIDEQDEIIESVMTSPEVKEVARTNKKRLASKTTIADEEKK